MSNQKQHNDPNDPLYYAPPWLTERNGGRYPPTPANGNGRDEPASSAPRASEQRRPDQRPSDQRFSNQRQPEQSGSNQETAYSRRGRASDSQNGPPPDIFAEAVAKAMEQELEPEYLEVPAALRENRSLGFAVKAAMAVGGAALIALVYVFYFSSADDTALASLPTWQSLTSSLFPASQPKAAPTLLVQDSNGPINEPLLLGVTVSAPVRGASVTIDRMAVGSRLTAGKRMSASEWRVPADVIAETSIIPPADFAGEMNLSATLRSSDGAALVSSFVRLSWSSSPPDGAASTSTDAPIQPSVVLAPAPQSQPAAAPQAAVPQPTPSPSMAPPAAAAQNVSSTPQASDAPAADLPASEIAYFVRRAQELMASGDVQAARLLLIRAARAHDARAALLLAKSYDPGGSRQSSAGDSGQDVEQARNWYQKAREWGSPDAQRQLDALASYR